MDQPIDESIGRFGKVFIMLKYLPWITFFRFIILRGLENLFCPTNWFGSFLQNSYKTKKGLQLDNFNHFLT